MGLRALPGGTAHHPCYRVADKGAGVALEQDTDNTSRSGVL